MRDFVQQTPLFRWLKDDFTQPLSIHFTLFGKNLWTECSSKCWLVPRIIIKLQ
jgi:hypothetical protein